MVGIVFRPLFGEGVGVFKLCNVFCLGSVADSTGEGFNALRGFGGLGGYLALVPLVGFLVDRLVLVLAGGGVPMVGIIFRPFGGEGVGVRLFPIAQSRRGKYILGNKRRCIAVIHICHAGDLIAV